MKVFDAIAISIGALAISMLIKYIDSISNPIMLAIIASLSATTFYFMHSSYSALIAADAKNKVQNSIIESMQCMLPNKGKTSIMSAISSAASLDDGVARLAFSEVYKNAELGENLTSAFNKSFRRHNMEKFHLRQSEDIYAAMGRFVKENDYERRSHNALLGQSLQRHATLSMFVSTIIPSFAMFLFVGNSIISSQDANLFAFTIVMLVALPLAYAISAFSFERRLIE